MEPVVKKFQLKSFLNLKNGRFILKITGPDLERKEVKKYVENILFHLMPLYKNRTIKYIFRRGKYGFIILDGRDHIVFHLGMTGKFFFIDQNKEKFKTSFYYLLNYQRDQKHNRVIFFLSKNLECKISL